MLACTRPKAPTAASNSYLRSMSIGCGCAPARVSSSAGSRSISSRPRTTRRTPSGFDSGVGSSRFGHVTDIGHMSEDVMNGLRGCSAILIEANHDVEMLRDSDYPASIRQRVGSRWGHLSNDALATYLEHRLPDGVRHLFLAHLSQQNNHERLAPRLLCHRTRAPRGTCPQTAPHLRAPSDATAPFARAAHRSRRSEARRFGGSPNVDRSLRPSRDGPDLE